MQTICADLALTPTGWARDLCVTVADGRISRVTAGAKASAPRVNLLLPAPVNLHSHAFQRAMAGLTEGQTPAGRDSFWTWRAQMYQFLDQLTPKQVEAIAALVFMEMVEAGYAGVAEFHYLHHDVGGVPYAQPAELAQRIVTAAQSAGIGLTLLPVLYMQGGCDGRPLAGGQKRFGNSYDAFAQLHEESAAALSNGHDDGVIGVAAHSLRAVPPDALDRLQADHPDGPFHMHLAEQTAEVEEVQAARGARPVEWLLDHAPVGKRWCLIHCTQMTAQETARLAASGAVAGLCPITESNLGDGIFDGIRYQADGGRFGVGSDSNVHIALWQELATLEYSQRLRDRARAALSTPDRSTGRVLYDACVAGGAQAAGRASGQIAEEQLADLIGITTDNEILGGRTGDTVLDSLIFSGRGQLCVTDVWSAGRHMVQGGRHIHRDRIVAAYRAATADLVHLA